MLGLQREEIDLIRYGEMMDLISCLAIYNGGAEEKRNLTFFEKLRLR